VSERRWALLLVLGAPGLCGVLGGCAVEDLQPDYEAARTLVRDTTGQQDVFDPALPPMSAAEVAAYLEGGLALDEALRLALLNNRHLHAAFLQLGVARADWVQAGLLRNPTLGLAFLLPAGGGRTRLAADMAQDIAGIWRLPAQRAAAQAGYGQRLLDVAQLAGDLIAQTQQAYIETAAAREGRALAAESAALARRTLAAMQTRVDIGAAAEVDANLLRSVALSAELEAGHAERESALAARRLGALLSLEPDLLDVELVDGVPFPAASSGVVGREAAAELARTNRIDVRAAAAALATAESRLRLERELGWPDVEAGVAAERPEGGSDSDFLAGPALGVEIPLFDRNEAGIRRAEAERDAERARYEAVLSRVLQEARAAADRLDLALRLRATVEADLLPQAERSTALAQQAFDLGQATGLAVLEAQRAVLAAKQAWLDARVEAALADALLVRAIGGPMPPPAPDAAEARP
jgi:outer membrane protein, heavy metal efflux system